MVEMSLRARRSNLKISYIIVLLLAAVLYVSTCAGGVLWQDSGMFQYRILHNDIQGNLGLALSHPLYHIIGSGFKYIPFGDLAFKVNLISAIFGAFTIANLFLLLRLWLGKILPAALAAVTLMLSHTLWLHSTIAECYTLYTALLIAELIMLLQYEKTKRILFLYLLAVFNGLAIANHMWASLAFACYFVFLITLLIKKQINLKHIFLMAFFWIIAAMPYEYLIVKNIIQTGDLAATISSALFGNGWQETVLNASLSTKIIKENLLLMAYNFSTPNILFFFAGLYGLKKLSPSRSFRNVLLAMLILFFVFAFRYTVPDRYAFFLPFYCLVAALVGVGFDLLFSSCRNKISISLVFIFALLPIASYAAAPIIAEKINFNISTKRQIHFRNDYKWFLQPWKNNCNSAEQFSNEAFKTVEENAVIYADGTTVYSLLYAQEIRNQRNDVSIISFHPKRKNPLVFNEETVPELLEQKTVYVVSPKKGYCPQFLLEQYEFEQIGVLWKVNKK